MTDQFRSGFASLVGRPNVGKSTLTNQLVGRKVSITSRRPQTTRHRILGIRTEADSQLVLVDTPGLHDPDGRMINRVINRTARSSLSGVDVVVLLIDARGWKDGDRVPLELATAQKVPVILAINKVDRLSRKEDLLPLIDESRRRFDFDAIVPISALSGHNVDALYDEIRQRLPLGPKCFPDDQVSDKSTRFMVAELVREQLFRQLGDELPYVTAVKIEKYDETPGRILVHADIWVDRDSHKGILIGKQGQRLKSIGASARREIEKLVNRKIHLELWVRVRKGWRDDSAALEGLGYSES
ncbi:MAG TPA: GTPase Era [Arenicellales bacterium]|nr:GTPase Era [Arenicellales bacterium]